ncbi:hypothetical protein J6590_038395 [Homalodisca vitripennis]|nr:hypothetical protein J6590_038395 [Homalodisca vitripennis]
MAQAIKYHAQDVLKNYEVRIQKYRVKMTRDCDLPKLKEEEEEEKFLKKLTQSNAIERYIAWIQRDFLHQATITIPSEGSLLSGLVHTCQQYLYWVEHKSKALQSRATKWMSRNRTSLSANVKILGEVGFLGSRGRVDSVWMVRVTRKLPPQG